MENFKKVSRAQWCLFALLIGFAFLMQNCQDDDVTIYEENQTATELNAKPPVSGKVDVCRFNARKNTYSVVSVVAKRVLEGDVIIDADGDGYVNANECGVVGDGIDCDDTNSAVTRITSYQDLDGDGYGNPSQESIDCTTLSGYVDNNLDCDDSNPDVTFATNFYHDADNDTFGDPYHSYEACVAPDGYVANNSDCDDNDPAITINTYYRDFDGDGFGDITISGQTCTPEAGYVVDNTDCDDTNDTINPNADEVCGDSIDNDCDGEIDEEGCVEKTNVPDNNFEQALIDLGHDDVLDGYVLTANIIGVTNLNVSNKFISDLKGIEDFAALQSLNCNYNDLISLDVSKNLVLRGLECTNNDLTSLNLINNTALRFLFCNDNQINSLNVSENAELRELRCYSNNLDNLDVSFNYYLYILVCNYNNLTSINLTNNADLGTLLINNNGLKNLDVSSNPALTYLSCSNNIDLNCIQVNSDQIASIPATWSIDDDAIYSLNCAP